MTNPFFHRGAIRNIENFHGRENETAQILGLLKNGQSVSLIGPRRIGKTSLLLHLCHPKVRQNFDLAAPRALFTIIDCQELGGSPAEEVYESFFAGLLDAASDAKIDVEIPNHTGNYRALDRLLNRISRTGTQVVFILDEFELLAGNEHLTPYFFARLRGLTTKYGLAYLTASQRPLFAITASEEILSSPFFNIFVTISLSEFSKEEAHSLLDQRMATKTFKFSSHLIYHMLELVGFHPFFLHLAGYHAYQMQEHGELSNPVQIDKPTEIEADAHLSYLWNSLSEPGRTSLVVLNGTIDIMRHLEQQCLIRATDQAPGYCYSSTLLMRFVRRQEVSGIVQAAPFVIDHLRHKVLADMYELDLTTSQFALLTCLAEHAGQVVPAAKLEEAVWGEALLEDPDRLKTLIKRLRRAIEPFDNWIASERGVGYALRTPE